MTSTEFRRWYYLKSELADFARSVGVSTSGAKPDIADRIHAFLEGSPIPAPTNRRSSGRKIDGPVDRDTIIPKGQTASQHLRPFFIDEIGPSFRYDWHMRTFLAENAGSTLGDAVDHWYATRDSPTPETPEQLEFVRFTKRWHKANPNGSAAECRAAWALYRSLPVDQRPS